MSTLEISYICSLNLSIDAVAPKVYTQRKIQLKPPVELPAWNVSTKPKQPFPNPKTPEVDISEMSSDRKDY